MHLCEIKITENLLARCGRKLDRLILKRNVIRTAKFGHSMKGNLLTVVKGSHIQFEVGLLLLPICVAAQLITISPDST